MNWTGVCNSDEVLEGMGKEVVAEGLPIAVFRFEGVLYALDGMCAHQGGPIGRGKVEGGCVTCPWHGWQYKLENGNNAATGKPMLSAYPIREVAGKVELMIPRTPPKMD